MKQFFQWATILVALAVVGVGAAYFFWLQPRQSLSPAVQTLSITAATAPVPDSAIRVTTPDPASSPTVTIEEGQSLADLSEPGEVEAPTPRPGIVILRPDSVTSESVTPESVTPDSMTEENTATDSNSENSSEAEADTQTGAQAIRPTPTWTPTWTPAPVATNTSVVDGATAAPVTAVATSTPAAPLVALAGVTPTVDAGWLRPAATQAPPSLAFNIATPTVRAQIIVAPVVTALPGTDAATQGFTPTLTPAPIQLYVAPNPQTAIAGATAFRAGMEIVARDTTGTWFLLVDGLWVSAADISDPPAQLPLVVPTITPTPTNTGTPTPTLIPEATATPLPTATPTPTPLDFPVCDCTPNTYACVTHNFTVRAQAQACFEYCFRMTGLDVHTLDPDGNGLACESLPE